MTVPQCECKRARVVWTHIARDGEALAGGMRVLRRQCPDCGALSSNSLPQHHAQPDTPNVDVDAVHAWNRKQKEYFALRRMSFLKEEGAAIQKSIRDQYEEYLQTEAWQAKRAKVLRRANWICEGCDAATATQVHHLSYMHLGDELLWELKAVCVACHAKCHPEKQMT